MFETFKTQDGSILIKFPEKIVRKYQPELLKEMERLMLKTLNIKNEDGLRVVIDAGPVTKAQLNTIINEENE